MARAHCSCPGGKARPTHAFPLRPTRSLSYQVAFSFKRSQSFPFTHMASFTSRTYPLSVSTTLSTTAFPPQLRFLSHKQRPSPLKPTPVGICHGLYHGASTTVLIPLRSKQLKGACALQRSAAGADRTPSGNLSGPILRKRRTSAMAGSRRRLLAPGDAHAHEPADGVWPQNNDCACAESRHPDARCQGFCPRRSRALGVTNPVTRA